MPRRPLPVGTWGRVSRTPVLRVDGRDVALVWRDRRAYRPGSELPVKPSAWVARARFRDADGSTRKVEAWGQSAGAAEAALVAAMTQRAASSGSDITPETRLSALADYWYRTEVEHSDRAANTRQRYRGVVDGYVIPGMGGLVVREATVARVDQFLRTTTDEKGAATAKLCRTVLSGMLALAVRHNAAAANPVRDAAAIESPEHEVRALAMAEVKALRASLAADKRAVRADLPDLVDVMLATGCRIGEALALRWEDIDLDAGTVKITGTVVRVKGDGLIRQDTTKGKKARASVLPKFAVDLLLDRSVNGLPPGRLNLVFPTANAGPREVATVEAQWRKFRERNPTWSWVTPHTFRRTVGTEVDRASGTDTAAAQLGHSSPRITAKHYVETPDLAPDVSDVLQRFGD